MSVRDTTLADGEKSSLTWRECRALGILAADGWERGTLAMVFECGPGTVDRHLSGNCRNHHK